MFTLPDDSFPRDQVTPHRLSLLILIKEYADIYDGKNKEYPRMVWQDEWVSKRHLDRSLLSWIQQPNGSLKDILRTVSICSKVLYNGFVGLLDAICNYESMGNLKNFFTSLGYGLFQEHDSLLHKRGLLGLFCRRMLVYYERLSFCEIQPFFENFRKYCSPHITLNKPVSIKVIKKPGGSTDASNVTVANTNDKETVDDMELESQSEMDSKSSRDSIDADLKPSDLKTEKCEDFEASEYFTQQQAEYFFSQQAALIEAKESDALPPASLQSKIRQVLKNNPDLTQAHYVSYLNNLRLREFCGALDGLFMYFIRHNKKCSPLNLKKFKEKPQRFATLNLAMLHLRFGHNKAALAACKEAINLAQLSNDSVCLQHAMSLLNHLQPKTSSHKVAVEIIKPAKKQNLTDLAFLAVQANMNQFSNNGEKPCLVFRNLAAADALQCTRPFSYFATTSFAHKASLWRMYGKRHMALLYCQLALGIQTTLDRKSHVCPVRYNSEDIALSLSHLMELLNEEGMCNSSSDLLSHAKIRFPPNSRHSHFWRKSEGRLNHLLNLRLCKYTEATQAEQTLMLHDPIESMFRKAENFSRRNENLKSHKILLDILNKKENEEITPEMKCQVYILMADLLSHNKCEQAASFRYLLEALSISQKCYFHNLTSEAVLKLAQLHLLSNSPQLGISCLNSIVFECMANACLHKRSKLLLIAVRCRMKKALTLNDIEQYISTLIQAQDGFDKTQDLARKRDVVYLLAKLHNEKAMVLESFQTDMTKSSVAAIQQRNEFASEFKRLDVQLGSMKFVALI